MAQDAAQRLRWSTVDDDRDLTLPGLGERITHPEFQGIEFVHVRAKSLLNHVPAAAGMPFEWTINVYRGCSHACTYCLAPDTPILMGDGRVRQLRHVRVGDEVVGTTRIGGCRRYTTTRVLDHWETVRHAYRLTLADGTVLVTSGDHRFLTTGGWKHVTPGTCRAGRRPHLTDDDSLSGPGGSADGPDHAGEPAQGYPRGLTRGAGGLRERLRSAEPTDPAVTRRLAIDDIAPERRADLRVVSIEDLGIQIPMHDLTTGTGDFVASGVISHNCFARPSHTYLDLDAGRDFETVIVVKINAVERLRAELRSPRWAGTHVALGTNTDPYQRCEGRYRLTRGVVTTLADAGNSFSVLTKGTLVTRDLDVLADAAARGVCTGVSLSIPTLDEDVWRTSEPGTPHPRARMETVAALNEAGVPSGVMVAPIMPGISDDPAQLEEVVAAAVAAGATSITPIVLHLRPGVREVFEPWLRDLHPDLLERYRDLYRRGYAPEQVRRRVAGTVHRLVERHGGVRRLPLRGRRSGHRVPEATTAATTVPEQLPLL